MHGEKKYNKETQIQKQCISQPMVYKKTSEIFFNLKLLGMYYMVYQAKEHFNIVRFPFH